MSTIPRLPMPDRSPEASTSAHEALASLWRDAGLPGAALERIELVGSGPVLPSSFAVADAAQASLGAAALAATELGVARGRAPRSVRVDRTHAVLESTCWFSI